MASFPGSNPKCGTESLNGRVKTPFSSREATQKDGGAVKPFLTHLGTDGAVSKGRRERTAGCSLGFLPSHNLYCAIFQHRVIALEPPRGEEQGKVKDRTNALHCAKFSGGGERKQQIKEFPTHRVFKKTITFQTILYGIQGD